MSEEKIQRALEKLRPIFRELPEDYTGRLQLELDLTQGGVKPEVFVGKKVIPYGCKASV